MKTRYLAIASLIAILSGCRAQECRRAPELRAATQSTQSLLQRIQDGTMSKQDACAAIVPLNSFLDIAGNRIGMIAYGLWDYNHCHRACGFITDTHWGCQQVCDTVMPASHERLYDELSAVSGGIALLNIDEDEYCKGEPTYEGEPPADLAKYLRDVQGLTTAGERLYREECGN